MAESNNSSPVSRREFYLMAGSVNIMIGLLALLLALKADGLYYPIVLWMISVGCLITGIMYDFAALRLGRAPSGRTDPVAASDRPGP